jgi:hypothetical protein
MMKVPRRSFLNLAAGTVALPARRKRSSLSFQADHHDRAVSSGRRDRRIRPHRQCANVTYSRPADRHRTLCWSRRYDRIDSRDARKPRWIYDRDGPNGNARYSGLSLSEPGLQAGYRLRADRVGQLVTSNDRGKEDFPPQDLKEFVSYVRANIHTLNMAHSGVGSISYSCSVLLSTILGIKPTMVPFNGAAQAMNALIGGHVDYWCDGGANNSVPHVQSGAIKAYLFEGERRSSLVPDVPTAKEAGLPEFRVLGWSGLFAPRATPKPILDKLTHALDEALDDQNVRKQMGDLASEIPGTEMRGQHALGALVRSDIVRWTKILKTQ